MGIRDSIRESLRPRTPITEDVPPEVLGDNDSSLIRDALVDELEAVSIYQRYSEKVTDPDVKQVLADIRDEEKVHIGELMEVLRKIDSTGFEKFIADGEGEAKEILESILKEATDTTFTIQYREDGKVKYSTVTANSGSDALNKFRQITRSQGRNVSAVSLAIQDIEIDESKHDDLEAKVKDYLNYHLSANDEYIPTVRDIKVLGKSDDGTVTVEATYDASVTIPYGRDPETGAVLYDTDTETRTDVFNIKETTNVIAPETNIIDKIALLNSDDQGEVLAKYLEDDVSEQELSKYIRSRMPKIHEALEDDPEVADQEISSAETSINSSKIPTLFHLVDFKNGSLNLDYGGGKFDNVADYLESEYGATNLVYDPYNRSSEHNKAVLDQVRKNGGADTVTCSNVLNVIKEPSARLAVIRNCKNYLKNGGTAYFTVYVGDSSGVGKITSKGYQLNQKTPWYVDEISQVFSNVSRKGQLIIAK